MDCDCVFSDSVYLLSPHVWSLPLSVCRHVMNELLETERAYVEELLCVLQVGTGSSVSGWISGWLCSLCFQGYASEMDNPAMLPLIPAPLQNKKEVLFGNMPEIYHFHKRWKSVIYLINTLPDWCLHQQFLIIKHLQSGINIFLLLTGHF